MMTSPSEITAVVDEIKARSYRGGKYYRVFVTTEANEKLSFDVSKDQLRDFMAATNKDASSELVGEKITLTSKGAK